MQLESLIASIAIDAKENRDVATADVAGAYLKTEMKDFVIVKVAGESSNIMCKVNPTFKKFITWERRKPVIYMRLKKALYGCMQSALLWYDTFKQQLEKDGFVLNPYDPCVANKDIKGKQCTILWYVDDSKVSHEDSRVVTSVIESIEKRFGK